jgi:hypothetical protein
MKKVLLLIIASGFLSAGLLNNVTAAQPASKATAKVGNIAILGLDAQDWTTILSNDIKTPNQKDLFIDVSLECGLYTATLVDSLAGTKDDSVAEAGVLVRVLVDGFEASPGEVVFCRRSQALSAVFQGLLEDEFGNSCLITTEFIDETDGSSTFVTSIDEDCLQPETLELVLDTMTATSFNFIETDLGSGVHTVEVQTSIATGTASTVDSGTKVKDTAGDDADENFDAGDTTLTVEKEGKVEVGQTIVIDDEQLSIAAINGKNLTVIRSVNGTADVFHAKRTRIYIVGGAEATASIGHGSMTVELVRLIKDEDVELE